MQAFCKSCFYCLPGHICSWNEYLEFNKTFVCVWLSQASWEDSERYIKYWFICHHWKTDFLFCHLNYLASFSDVCILLFLLKSSFSAYCLLPMEAFAHCNKATLRPFFSNRLNCAIHSPWSIFLSFYIISLVHRLAEVGRHLWRPFAQNRVTQRRLLRTVSNQVWNKYQMII